MPRYDRYMDARPISCNPRGLSRRSIATDFRDAKRPAVERIEERPPPDHQAEAADVRRLPERAVRRDPFHSGGDLVEARLRLRPDVGRRCLESGLRHDHATGQSVSFDSLPTKPPQRDPALS